MFLAVEGLFNFVLLFRSGFRTSPLRKLENTGDTFGEYLVDFGVSSFWKGSSFLGRKDPKRFEDILKTWL